MTDEQINMWGVYDAIREAQAACGSGAADGAAIALRSGLQFVEDVEGPKGIHLANALERVAQSLAGGAPQAAQELADLALEVQSRVPDFRIVLLEETSDWDEAIRSQAGRIFGAYLYDARRSTYLAELQPSYELHHLYTTATNTDLPDDIEEALLVNGGPEDGSMYMHVRVVDAIPWERKSVCSEPSTTQAETYDELVKDEVEAYRANVDIQLPQPLVAQLGAFYAQRLIERGAMDEANALVDAMPQQEREVVLGAANGQRDGESLTKGLDVLHKLLDGARQEQLQQAHAAPVGVEKTLSVLCDRAYGDYIERMRRSECLGAEAKIKAGEFTKAELDAHTRASEFLGASRAYAEAAKLAAAAGLEAAQGRAAKGGKFLDEVLAEYESLQLLAEHFGTATLADVTYVMASIVQGASFEVWPSQTTGSRIDEVVCALPSSEEWLVGLKFMNKYGDQVPHSVFKQDAPEIGAAPSI